MDLLVKLYSLKESDLQARQSALSDLGVVVRRAMTYEKRPVVSFVRDHFTAKYTGWPSECDVALSRVPTGCLIATRQERVVGFACYDSTFKGFFGPAGVLDSFRGQGIGAALLLAALFAMKADGYAYAIIGGVNQQAGFYERVAGASKIAGSERGGYPTMLADLIA
jgi:GNAT superfamily N-acetyltransferase